MSAKKRKLVNETVVTTFVGGDQPGFVDGDRATAQLGFAVAVTFDVNGNLVFVDSINRALRSVTTDGVVKTLAGRSPGSADRNGAEAEFMAPIGVAADVDGNILVADSGSHQIRKISLQGAVTTVAGSGEGYADGKGRAALFHAPFGIAVSDEGDIYVADTGNHRIRKVQPDGQVTTLAGGTAGFADGRGGDAQFNSPCHVVFDREGKLIVADFGNARIREVSLDGVVTTLAGAEQGFADGKGAAAKFQQPRSIALDGDGNTLVADVADSRIRKVTPEGEVTTLVGGEVDLTKMQGDEKHLREPRGIAIDRDGAVFVAAAHRILRIDFARRVEPPLPRKCRSSFKEDFGARLDDPDFSDVTFIVGKDRILASRFVLTSRSEYFRKLLSSHFREGNTAEVEVQDTTAAAFRSILMYLYTDELVFNDEDIVEVMRLADQYDLRRVFSHCVSQFKTSTTVDNAVDRLLRAYQCGLQNAVRSLIAFVARNYREIRSAGDVERLVEYQGIMIEITDAVAMLV